MPPPALDSVQPDNASADDDVKEGTGGPRRRLRREDGPVRNANPRTIAIWTVVALVGALGWAVLALSRGEEVSAAWMVAAALGSYAIAYRFYARFIANRVLKVDKTRATPAERLDN